MIESNFYILSSRSIFDHLFSTILLFFAKGGEKAVSLISRKKFLAISGHNAGGGYVRIDIAHRGEPFRGQVTVGNFGKRGLGKDYIGEAASALLTAEPAVAAWPE